jgi:hypothetical protein
MKSLRLFTLVTVGLSMSLLMTQASFAEPQITTIKNTLETDPTTLTGISGGSMKKDCGYLPKTPSQIIEVTEPLPYLQLTVESEGQPTLLIKGPGGRFCVLSNDEENQPQLSGYWSAGIYSVYIGELSKEKYNYTLSISQEQK